MMQKPCDVRKDHGALPRAPASQSRLITGMQTFFTFSRSALMIGSGLIGRIAKKQRGTPSDSGQSTPV